MTTDLELSPWFCDACNQRVILADAVEHYRACVGGDRCCPLCGASTADGGLCRACRVVATVEPKR